MKSIDLQKLAQYADQYVGLSEDRTEILASAKTIDELENLLEKGKITKAIIHYVPPLNVYLSPVCR